MCLGGEVGSTGEETGRVGKVGVDDEERGHRRNRTRYQCPRRDENRVGETFRVGPKGLEEDERKDSRSGEGRFVGSRTTGRDSGTPVGAGDGMSLERFPSPTEDIHIRGTDSVTNHVSLSNCRYGLTSTSDEKVRH